MRFLEDHSPRGEAACPGPGRKAVPPSALLITCPSEARFLPWRTRDSAASRCRRTGVSPVNRTIVTADKHRHRYERPQLVHIVKEGPGGLVEPDEIGTPVPADTLLELKDRPGKPFARVVMELRRGLNGRDTGKQVDRVRIIAIQYAIEWVLPEIGDQSRVDPSGTRKATVVRQGSRSGLQ